MCERYAKHRTVLAVALLLVLATLCPPATAHASTARIRSLGGAGHYFEDADNVTTWFGSLLDYPDLAVLEVGDYDFTASSDQIDQQATGQGGGIHFQADEAGKWGTFAFYFNSNIPEPEPGGMFTAMYGRQVGPLALGLYFRGSSYFSYTQSNTQFKYGRSHYYHDFGAGVRFDLNPDAYVDLAGQIINTKCDVFDEFRNIDMENLSSWDSYGGRIRAFVKLSEQVTLVPVFSHFQDRKKTYSDILDDAANTDSRLTFGGFGLNIFADPDNLVLFSAEYRSGRDELIGFQSQGARYYVGDHDYFSWRTRFGLESRLLSWLTLRAGTEYRRLDDQYLYDRQPEQGERVFDGAHIIDVQIALDLGIGLHFGSFDCDVVFNDDAPFSLGHFLTGAGESEASNFTSVTLSYYF